MDEFEIKDDGSAMDGSYLLFPRKSRACQGIAWLTISDPEQAVIDDVIRIRNHPLVPATVPI